jgi:hypothetical protein
VEQPHNCHTSCSNRLSSKRVNTFYFKSEHLMPSWGIDISNKLCPYCDIPISQTNYVHSVIYQTEYKNSIRYYKEQQPYFATMISRDLIVCDVSRYPISSSTHGDTYTISHTLKLTNHKAVTTLAINCWFEHTNINTFYGQVKMSQSQELTLKLTTFQSRKGLYQTSVLQLPKYW